MLEPIDPHTPAPEEQVGFPWLLLALLVLSMSGLATIQALIQHDTGLTPALRWTGVLVFGGAAGLVGWPFGMRVRQWAAARQAAGRTSRVWEILRRLP